MAAKHEVISSFLQLGKVLVMAYLLPGNMQLMDFPLFKNYLNNAEKTGKIKFSMEIAGQEKGLESLDLRIKCVEVKLSVDAYAKLFLLM